MNWLFDPFYAVWKSRRILLTTTWAEIRSAYVASLLGSSWIVIGQLMMLGVYATTFLVIFKFRPTEMTAEQYLTYVFCGLTSVLPFSSALTAGSMSLISSRNVLLNTVFPAELIPMRTALVASISMPAGLVILFFADLYLGKFTYHNMIVPLILILQTMFVIGIVWIFSLAALIFRDIQHLLNYSLTMLMVITPIAYTPTMVPDGIKGVIYFNPLAYYVMSIQYLVVLDKLPDMNIAIPMVIISFLVFGLGFMLVRRAKSAFYDYA